jgi:hypothetical protein
MFLPHKPFTLNPLHDEQPRVAAMRTALTQPQQGGGGGGGTQKKTAVQVPVKPANVVNLDTLF